MNLKLISSLIALHFFDVALYYFLREAVHRKCLLCQYRRRRGEPTVAAGRSRAVNPTVSTDLSLSRLGSVLTVAMVGRRYLIGSNEALLPRLACSGLEMGHRQPMPMS